MKPEIVSIKRVKNNRLQAELVDTVQRGKLNTLAALNKGDEAFKSGSIRHAWFPVTTDSLIDLGASAALIEKIEALKEKESIDTTGQFVEPRVNGERLRIQITETVVPNDYQRQNYLKAAKQLEITAEVCRNANLLKHDDCGQYIGDNGYFLTETNEYIFSNSTVEIEPQVKNTFLEGMLVPEKVAARLGAELAKSVKSGVGAF